MSQRIDFNQQPGVENTTAENQIPGQSLTIPVIEEQVHIGKQVIESGRVLISKKVLEEQTNIDIPVLHEEHDIERVPVNQYLNIDAAPPAMRHEGDTIIIPVLREEVVMQKRLVLVEELRITKRQVQTSTSQQVLLRKEEVNVERIDLNTNTYLNNTTTDSVNRDLANDI